MKITKDSYVTCEYELYTGEGKGDIVEKITDDTVTMDFNHPLAGQTLHFIGSVLEARPATEEDRQRLTAQFSGHAGGCCDGDDHEGGCSCCSGCH